MLAIGPMRFAVPAVQAALSGYSDLAMRVMSRRCGAPYAISEGLLDKALVAGNTRKRVIELSDEDHPVAGQLLGSEPAVLAEAARALVAAGYDAVDVNFGCPVRKVMGKCRGGYLLGEPETALEIVRRVRDAVPPHVPVTLKMRRGVEDGPAAEADFFAILDGAFAAGVAAITVHGRTVKQLYVGPAKWEFLAKVKAHAGARTIIGSGDLWNGADAVRMMRETGVDGVSLARGAIGNPWIFAEFAALSHGGPAPAAPTLAEQAEVLAEHYRLAEGLYGDERAERMMRKFALKYAARHPQPQAAGAALLAAKSADDRAEALRRWYYGFDPTDVREAGSAEPAGTGAA